MSSGVFSATGDLDARCRLCGWEGDVVARADGERRSLTWNCPGCGHEEEEDYR